MPSCSAFGCTNRSTQGYLMKVFPRNPLRRALWAAKVKRKDWFPNDHSYLCEVHFDKSQWKPLSSKGKRRLKDTAVPTLFCFTAKQSQNENSSELKNSDIDDTANTSSSISPINGKNENSMFMNEDTLSQNEKYLSGEKYDSKIHNEDDEMSGDYSSSNSEYEGDKYDEHRIKYYVESHKLEINKHCSKSDKIKTLKNYVWKLENELKATKKDLLRKEERLQLFKKKLRKVRVEKKHIEITDHEKMIKSIFNDDQIAALSRKSTNYMKWCNDTIEKAIQIKSICGMDGYNLIRNIIPLPSIRTLQRHLERLKKYPDYKDDVSSCSDMSD